MQGNMQPDNADHVRDVLVGGGPAGIAAAALPADDSFGRTPIRRSLGLFKVIYLLTSLTHPRRSFAAWRQRTCNVRCLDGSAGEVVFR